MFNSTPPVLCKRMGTSVLILTAVLASAGAVRQVAVASDKQQVFTGILEQRFEPTQQVYTQSHVIVNADGYRVESLPRSTGEIIIANSILGKTWFVDTNRSLIHEVPFKDVEGAPELAEPVIALPGFIHSVPCIGQDSQRDGDVQYKGRTLERWTCTINNPDNIDDDELPVEQYFSKEHGIVIFSRSRSDIITELTDIAEDVADRKIFTPPEGLRSVTIEEFMGQAPLLEQYNSGDQ